ncbi:hypothetical protein Pelo_17190 [Pelomyxa schiedti]|nr:hypothetical protein Pelo_17190 [Pelomyxa schiedti]
MVECSHRLVGLQASKPHGPKEGLTYLAFDDKIPPTLRNPTDIYRAILDARPGKSLHHKLRTTMIEKPTPAHWINLVKNLNTKGVPPTLRNHALQIATSMKPPEQLHVPHPPHCLNMPGTAAIPQNTCHHNSAKSAARNLRKFQVNEALRVRELIVRVHGWPCGAGRQAYDITSENPRTIGLRSPPYLFKYCLMAG